MAILALTHPHQDHYPGFVDLIDRYDDAFPWVRSPQRQRHGQSLPIDAMAAHSRKGKPTYTRIWEEWSRPGVRQDAPAASGDLSVRHP